MSPPLPQHMSSTVSFLSATVSRSSALTTCSRHAHADAFAMNVDLTQLLNSRSRERSLDSVLSVAFAA
ncbi:hypothetical protein DIPPA_23400 [Diplonema papillatum]|nr:hypothetical protein DIPPA_23400 [Diplonema papillatum]